MEREARGHRRCNEISATLDREALTSSEDQKPWSLPVTLPMQPNSPLLYWARVRETESSAPVRATPVQPQFSYHPLQVRKTPCHTQHPSIALLRRRAAVTRAVLPRLSARAEWLLAGLADRALNRWGRTLQHGRAAPRQCHCGALHHWSHVPPFDGGIGDHADSETDTTIPDDDDGTAFLASQSFEYLQPSSLWLPASALTGQFATAL